MRGVQTNFATKEGFEEGFWKDLSRKKLSNTCVFQYLIVVGRKARRASEAILKYNCVKSKTNDSMRVGVDNATFDTEDEHPAAIELKSNATSNNNNNNSSIKLVHNDSDDNNNNNSNNNLDSDNNNNAVDVQYEKDKLQTETKQKGLEAFDADPESPESGKEQVTTVKRSVGLMGAVSLIIGSMIGSGIFASTAPVISHTGSIGLSLAIWTVSGFVCTGAALCYVELGTMIPKSGGEFVYLRAAYGEIPAFLMSFTTIVILKPAQLSAIVLATGNYIVEPIAALQNEPETKMLIAKALAAFFLGMIVFVNCISIRLALRVQIIFTIAKLSAIAMLIITGLVKLGQGHTENFENPFKNSTSSVSDMGFAFYGSLWAYDSWNNLNFLTDEIQNPFRTLPLAIMIGIPSVTFCYVMMNVAYSVFLTNQQIATSEAVAVLVSKRCYGVMWWIIPILVACSTFGSANGCAFGVGRLISVSAKEGHMPQLLALVHKKRNTPIPALTFICIIGWIMLTPNSSNFETLINYFNFAAWIFYGTTISSVLWLRYRRPEWKRPYKVFIGVPIVCLLCALYLVIAPFVRNPWPSFGVLCFILLGIPLYLAFVKNKIMPKPMSNGFYKLTEGVQKAFNLCIPSAPKVDETE